MTPYRSAPALTRCPRCGNALDTIREGLAACESCHGVWLGAAAIKAAFGAWPTGTNAWWKRELECPVCNQEMEAVMVGDILIDRCTRHGAWFDPGELGRLLGAPKSEELGALYRRIAPGEATPEVIARQRIRDAERVDGTQEADAAAARADDARAEVAFQRHKIALLRAQLEVAEVALAAALRKLG